MDANWELIQRMLFDKFGHIFLFKMSLDSCKDWHVSGLPEYYKEFNQIWVKAKTINQNNIDTFAEVRKQKIFRITNTSSLSRDVFYIHIG